MRTDIVFTSCIAALFAFVAAGAQAQSSVVVESPVRPSDPVLEATGGGSVARPSGTQGIRLNPADFRGSGRLTVFAGGAGLAVPPSRLGATSRAFLRGRAVPLPGSLAAVHEREISRSGFGFSGSGEIAYTGNSLGIGITSDHEVFMRTRDGGSEADGFIRSDTALIAGVAIPFEVGAVDVSIGAALRPFMRVRGDLQDPAAIADFAGGTPFVEAFADTPVLNGFGLGVDLGLLARYNDFSFGFSARDIGNTEIRYRVHTLAEVLDTVVEGRLPDGGESANDLFDPDARYIARTSTRLGAAWDPNLEADFDVVDPLLFAELRDGHRIFSGEKRPWEYLAAGVEATVAGFFTARAGISGDGFGLGAGFRAGPLFLDSALRFGGNEADRGSFSARLRF